MNTRNSSKTNNNKRSREQGRNPNRQPAKKRKTGKSTKTEKPKVEETIGFHSLDAQTQVFILGFLGPQDQSTVACASRLFQKRAKAAVYHMLRNTTPENLLSKLQTHESVEMHDSTIHVLDSAELDLLCEPLRCGRIHGKFGFTIPDAAFPRTPSCMDNGWKPENDVYLRFFMDSDHILFVRDHQLWVFGKYRKPAGRRMCKVEARTSPLYLDQIHMEIFREWFDRDNLTLTVNVPSDSLPFAFYRYCEFALARLDTVDDTDKLNALRQAKSIQHLTVGPVLDISEFPECLWDHKEMFDELWERFPTLSLRFACDQVFEIPFGVDCINMWVSKRNGQYVLKPSPVSQASFTVDCTGFDRILYNKPRLCLFHVSGASQYVQTSSFYEFWKL